MAATLIDTSNRFDAGLLGYDGPCDPNEDAEGLIVTEQTFAGGLRAVTLRGPDGEVEILGEAAIREVAKTLLALITEQQRAA